MSTSEPGWRPDPTGRHEYRYWDGAGWDAAVADGGVEQHDPIDPVPLPAAVPPVAADVPPVLIPSSPARPASSTSSTSTGLLITIGVVILTLIGVVVGLVVAQADDPEPSAGTAAPPRDLLLDLADLPEDWEEGAAAAAPQERGSFFCEQESDAGPSRDQAEVTFVRSEPTGWMSHQVSDNTPTTAIAFVDGVVSSAEACGTWTLENELEGTTYEQVWSADIVVGPQLGDQSAWFELEVESRPAEESGPTTEEAGLIVVVRHGGLLSILSVSSPGPLSDDDRALTEQLAAKASERLSR